MGLATSKKKSIEPSKNIRRAKYPQVRKLMQAKISTSKKKRDKWDQPQVRKKKISKIAATP